MTQSSTRAGLVRCSIAAVLFGVSAPLASRLTDDMGAFTLAGLLYLGAALAVVPSTIRHRPSPAALRASAPRLAGAVVLGGAVGPVLLAFGLERVPAATSSLLLNLELVFTTLVAGLLFREHIGRRVGTGTALVVAGGMVLGWSGDPALRWGALLIAGACLCWAFDNSITAALDRIAPAHITLVKGVIAGSVNLAIGLAVSHAPDWGPILWALVVGSFGYGASITLWVAGARDLGAARGQLVFATAPFIGALVAWLVLADAVTAREVVAFALGLAGVSFVMRSAHEHEHAHEALEHDHEHEHDEHHHHHHDGHEHEHAVGRHSHPHRHEPLVHAHPHVPDLHHRHTHD
jgi:drug/metabolite transporter (DMT)-like permease